MVKQAQLITELTSPSPLTPARMARLAAWVVERNTLHERSEEQLGWKQFAGGAMALVRFNKPGLGLSSTDFFEGYMFESII